MGEGTFIGDLRIALVRAPMFRATVPFVAGLLLASGWSFPPAVPWILVVVTCTALVAAHRSGLPYGRRWCGGLAMGLIMASLGLLWGTLRRSGGKELMGADGRGPTPILVELDELLNVPRSYARYRARVLTIVPALAERMTTTPVPLLLTLQLEEGAPAPVPGDRLWVRVVPRSIDRVADPIGFDLQRWAAGKGIQWEAFAMRGDHVRVGHRSRWTDAFAEWRSQLDDWLRTGALAPRERALARALVLGLKDELDRDQRAAFARSGTMHVLALSGLHVGILFAVMSALLGWWGQRPVPRLLRGSLILLALWTYAGLTGASPSVLRATFMFSLFTLAGMTGRHPDALNSLFAAAFVLLLWDPLMLMQLSFQLSFLAVLGIVLFYKHLLALWKPPGWLLHKAWSIVAVSLAAQLMTTPLAVFVFKAFPTWFLPANLLVVGFISMIVCGSALVLVFGHIPWLGSVLAWVMEQLLGVLGRVTAWIASWPGAYPSFRIDPYQCALLYLLVAATAAWAVWRSRPFRAMTLIVFLVALVGWGAHARRTSTLSRLVVHDRSAGMEISIQRGRMLVLLEQDTGQALLDQDALERTTGAKLAGIVPLMSVDARPVRERSNGIIAVQGVRIFVFDDRAGSVRAMSPLPVTLVLIIEDGYHDLEELTTLVTSEHGIVLGPGVGAKERGRIRRWCAIRELSCHDVRSHGALIFDLP